jgi:hypothetical protein
MEKIKKLFGGLNLTWPKIIIWAILAGVYTAVMAMLPIAKDTSFADISITFEVWVLFGIIIIMNSKSAIDSGLKCFVFFLISQPLVYLIQVLAGSAGWNIFQYYEHWFILTILTFPMGCIGHFMKKGKWWGLLILSPMLLLVGGHYITFLSETLTYFPHHLLSALFCIVTLILYPSCIFEDRNVKRAGIIISVVILIGASAYGFMNRNNYYETTIMASNSEEVAFDDTYTAYFEDEKYGNVTIEYNDEFENYNMIAQFKKTGETKLIIESPQGEQIKYNITIGRDTYHLEKIE